MLVYYIRKHNCNFCLSFLAVIAGLVTVHPLVPLATDRSKSTEGHLIRFATTANLSEPSS